MINIERHLIGVLALVITTLGITATHYNSQLAYCTAAAAMAISTLALVHELLIKQRKPASATVVALKMLKIFWPLPGSLGALAAMHIGDTFAWYAHGVSLIVVACIHASALAHYASLVSAESGTARGYSPRRRGEREPVATVHTKRR